MHATVSMVAFTLGCLGTLGITPLVQRLATAAGAIDFLAAHARRGAAVLIGGPGRSYLPRARLVRIADYRVPVTRELEDAEIKHTAVWALRA